MRTDSMVWLTDFQAARVYKMAGEQPPEELANHHPMPHLALCDRFTYARKIDPEGTEEFSERCGYGTDPDGEAKPYPLGWVMGQLSTTEKRAMVPPWKK